MTGQIDFARAARGPKTDRHHPHLRPLRAGRGGLLVLRPRRPAPRPRLTTAQLQSLYSSGTGTTTIGGDTVKPCLTITGSTPRSNLETAIGVSDATAQATAHAAGCDQIQQNSGNAFYTFANTLPADTDAVIPISSGDWIAQANGVAVDESATARANGVDPRHRSPTGAPASGLPTPERAPTWPPTPPTTRTPTTATTSTPCCPPTT